MIDPCEAGSTVLRPTRVIEEAEIRIEPGPAPAHYRPSNFPPQIREEAERLVERLVWGDCDEDTLCDFLERTSGCFCEHCHGCVLLGSGRAEDVDCDSIDIRLDPPPCSPLLPTAVLQQWLTGLQQRIDRGPQVVAEVDLLARPQVIA